MPHDTVCLRSESAHDDDNANLFLPLRQQAAAVIQIRFPGRRRQSWFRTPSTRLTSRR
ncbi:hypothetical protein GCM10027259_18150 [Micromonospora palomenae]